ncbi:MAG: cobalamin biosynthesis protein CobD [Nitrospirae bacterium]|nr:MAG: cobalamin biosynthesis protein CobD [Nitrospirota bacterium]
MSIEPVLVALAIDLLIGDPRWMPHPVRWIGRLIELTELWIRKYTYDDATEKAAGAVTVVVVVTVTGGVAFLIDRLIAVVTGGMDLAGLSVSDLLVGAVGSFSLALRSLSDEALRVLRGLRDDDIELARRRLSGIVGRDTKVLNEEGIIRATVETVAENASDGVVAPMFYFFLFGLPGAFIYKAVNTLDSMLGYKNERYRHFGLFAARCDDVLNFIPARITGLFIAFATALLQLLFRGISFVESLSTFLSDGNKHTSPNAGYPEAAMAGALGIRLGGPNYYGGRLVEKPYIGKERKRPEIEDGILSIYIVGVAVFLFVMAVVVLTALL